jgi:hypothetical protein
MVAELKSITPNVFVVSTCTSYSIALLSESVPVNNKSGVVSVTVAVSAGELRATVGAILADVVTSTVLP